MSIIYISNQKDEQCALSVFTNPHMHLCTCLRLHVAGTDEPKSAQEVKHGPY